jgi:hypothetical protein
MVLAVMQPLVAHFLGIMGRIDIPFPIKGLGEPLEVHVKRLAEAR